MSGPFRNFELSTLCFELRRAQVAKMAKAPVLETGNCGFESHPVYQFSRNGDECKAVEHAVFRTASSGFETRRPFQEKSSIFDL